MDWIWFLVLVYCWVDLLMVFACYLQLLRFRLLFCFDFAVGLFGCLGLCGFVLFTGWFFNFVLLFVVLCFCLVFWAFVCC